MRRVLVGFTVRMGAALLASILLMGATPQPVAASDDGAVMGPNANTSHQPIAPLSPRNTKGGTRGGTRGTNTNTNRGTNTGAGTTNDGTTAATTNTDTTTAATVTTDVGAATTNDGTTAATTNTATTTAEAAAPATVTTDVGAPTTNDGTTAATTNTRTTTAEGANVPVRVAAFQNAPPAPAAAAQPGAAVMGVQNLPSTSTDPATAATLATFGLGALAGGLLALRRR